MLFALLSVVFYAGLGVAMAWRAGQASAMRSWAKFFVAAAPASFVLAMALGAALQWAARSASFGVYPGTAYIAGLAGGVVGGGLLATSFGREEARMRIAAGVITAFVSILAFGPVALISALAQATWSGLPDAGGVLLAAVLMGTVQATTRVTTYARLRRGG